MNDWKLFKLSLKNHPGVDVASWLTVAGILAGATGEHAKNDIWMSMMIGGLAMSIFWIPVIWTAWTLRGQYETDKRTD